MFDFMKQAAPKPMPVRVVNTRGGTAPGKMFDMKNLGSIMKIKSTGCTSCGR